MTGFTYKMGEWTEGCPITEMGELSGPLVKTKPNRN